MKEKDTLVKAVRYIKQEEDKKLTDLINKWRDVCFKSSNYLYNHYSIEMMKYGGKRQFRQNYLDRQSKLNQPYDELDHDNHNDDDDEEDTGNDGKRKRQSYQDYDEYEPTKYDEHPIKDDYVDDDEFTMKDLYYYLNKDHKLVYES
ncbi:hypothetical protein DFJ63DRAFT_315842 [Scheffersomyces coipomensis]|uniref:uncharacterized protein n=1 Tax=Scheffersomyces coipomensis TaxID=1788519 RepID=UPI00315C5B49